MLDHTLDELLLAHLKTVPAMAALHGYNRDRTPPLVNLKAMCGPRDIDDPQPAITVMLPDED